jgi:hypothetical protein
MRKRAKALPTLASEVAKAGSEAILREWLDVMPVDTSEAISNTRVGIGTRPSGVLPPFYLGRKGSTRSASAGKALQQGQEELKAKQPGQTIYVSNTAPHIGDLDTGTSQQFAGGFIPAALIVFRVAAQAAAKRLLK